MQFKEKMEQKNKNKAVIFDLDGTVIDTIYDITDAMNVMTEKFGFRKVSVDVMKASLGGDTKDIVRLAIGQVISEELLDKCAECYATTYINSGSPKTEVFKGMEKVIRELKERGYIILALSNKPDVEIAPLADRLLKPLGFDKVVGLSEKVVPKPKPDGALLLLKEFNASAGNSYFVGDGETDILTAINAKITPIAVLWGNRDKEFLKGYGAEIFARSPEELLNLIK